jgi:hypothetical protein
MLPKGYLILFFCTISVEKHRWRGTTFSSTTKYWNHGTVAASCRIPCSTQSHYLKGDDWLNLALGGVAFRHTARATHHTASSLVVHLHRHSQPAPVFDQVHLVKIPAKPLILNWICKGCLDLGCEGPIPTRIREMAKYAYLSHCRANRLPFLHTNEFNHEPQLAQITYVDNQVLRAKTKHVSLPS